MSIIDVGDIVWVDFNPGRGTEQLGHRPALVLTDRSFHEVSPRAVVCPITSRVRGWSTEVELPADAKTHGAILVDQVRSVDRTMRGFRFVERVPAETLRQVRGRLAALLQLGP
ncbi:MAG TPA: type II toxin-antitoxin system PemK/MazF family toxin [Hyphomicrobiales bacterium]|nr:type II toxin-antitoxin system PemK/MazF family toxin [Hyphomicrobiales bacterium]